MEQRGNGENAVSSVIGVVLLVAMTVLMVSLIALSVLAFEPPQPAPYAKILVVEARGGLPKYYGVGFDENEILIKHKGGDSLRINDIKIVIAGIGQAHRPCAIGGNCTPVPSASPYTGEISILYKDATTSLKDRTYKGHNPSLSDGFFDPGDSLLLRGDDRAGPDDDASGVVVSVNGDGDTSNKYAFKDGTKVTVMLIDIPSNQIIASSKATVKKAE